MIDTIFGITLMTDSDWIYANDGVIFGILYKVARDWIYAHNTIFTLLLKLAMEGIKDN